MSTSEITERQRVIDIVGIAGYYALLAMVMNVARTAVPEGPPLPLPALPVRTTERTI